ncbi:hypothetical protein [Paludifilum halophilum]|uniref:hypothetical protein n=1 Tax=Paludifilum halophilum TaxID=1642702 RepID=UPI001F0B20A3|nr:hypothetical protein [Paludifilum halophilum]
MAIGVGLVGIYFWTLKAVTLTTAEGINAPQDPVFTVNSQLLWTGIIIQLISLAAMFALSVFKPWGERKKRRASV